MNSLGNQLEVIDFGNYSNFIFNSRSSLVNNTQSYLNVIRTVKSLNGTAYGADLITDAADKFMNNTV